MATEQKPEQDGQVEMGIPQGSQEMVPIDAREPLAPQGISDKEVQSLKSRAADLVGEMEGASGSRELELTDSITMLGVQAQRTAGHELDLLRGGVGTMLTREGAGGEISKDLVDRFAKRLRSINHE